ncbi:MAG TPA: type II toxin-antitoxin system HicB family antitoxin [Bryobacteraceae bacterium]
MRNEFTAIVENDGPWYVAYCAEVPGANGQGKSRAECLASLREAIALVRTKLDRRYDDLKSGRVRPISGDEVWARLRAKSAR